MNRYIEKTSPGRRSRSPDQLSLRLQQMNGRDAEAYFDDYLDHLYEDEELDNEDIESIKKSMLIAKSLQ